MDIVSIIALFFKWLFEAAIQYNATPEGDAALRDILDWLEALGIDVPFYTPTDETSPLDMPSVPQEATAQDVAVGAAFRARHPELFKQEGSDK